MMGAAWSLLLLLPPEPLLSRVVEEDGSGPETLPI